jgi:hypothetical protein
VLEEFNLSVFPPAASQDIITAQNDEEDESELPSLDSLLGLEQNEPEPEPAPPPATPVRAVSPFQDPACLVEGQARPVVVDGCTAESVGPIRIPVFPCWIHIGAKEADDRSALSKRSSISCTSDWTLLISEITASCHSLATASWAGQYCCMISSSGVTTLAREPSTVRQISSIPCS